MAQDFDTPRTARRREREKTVVSQMIAIFCAGHHDAAARRERSHCGERICPACAELDALAVRRTARCRRMEAKTSCRDCEHHCYPPAEAERIRAVMRYAGPRMLLRHPVAAIRHLLGR